MLVSRSATGPSHARAYVAVRVEAGHADRDAAVVRRLVELHVGDQGLIAVGRHDPVQQHGRVAGLGPDDAPGVQQRAEPLEARDPVGERVELRRRRPR